MRLFVLLLAFAASHGLAFAFSAAETAEATHPLTVGARVPALEVRDSRGAVVSLNERFSQKTTVLVVFRGGWCPYCTKHLSALAEIEARFTELGVQVLAVSTDTPEKLAKVSSETHSTFELFSDRTMAAAGPLGLAFKLSKETATKYQGFGIDAPTLPDGEGVHWLPVPAVFIIDTQQQIRFAYSESNYKTRLSASDLLAAVQSLQP